MHICYSFNQKIPISPEIYNFIRIDKSQLLRSKKTHYDHKYFEHMDVMIGTNLEEYTSIRGLDSEGSQFSQFQVWIIQDQIAFVQVHLFSCNACTSYIWNFLQVQLSFLLLLSLSKPTIMYSISFRKKEKFRKEKIISQRSIPTLNLSFIHNSFCKNFSFSCSSKAYNI